MTDLSCNLHQGCWKLVPLDLLEHCRSTFCRCLIPVLHRLRSFIKTQHLYIIERGGHLWTYMVILFNSHTNCKYIMKIINWTAASTSDMYSYLTHRITVQQKEPISQFSQRTDVNTSPIEQVSHIVWQ